MRSVLIIGGNSDIGFSIAKAFAKNKYDIHLASRNINQMKIKKRYIENNFSINCKISFFDFCDKKSVNNFLKKNIISPNLLIICAGFLEKKETNVNNIININFLYPVYYIELFLKKYMKQGLLKTIIGISSVAGERGKKKNNIYAASKSGFSNYLDGLRQRLYQKNINVITVKPGYIKTKMTYKLNLPKILVSSPDEVGFKVYDAFLKKKNVLFVPSIWFVLILIYKLIPEIVFKFIYKKNIYFLKS
jgi:short-subunit dehydrogenase